MGTDRAFGGWLWSREVVKDSREEAQISWRQEESWVREEARFAARMRVRSD